MLPALQNPIAIKQISSGFVGDDWQRLDAHHPDRALRDRRYPSRVCAGAAPGTDTCNNSTSGANVLSNCTQAPVFLLSHLMGRVAPPMGRSKRCMTDRVRGVIVTDTVVPYLPRRVACVKPYTRRGSEKVF